MGGIPSPSRKAYCFFIWEATMLVKRKARKNGACKKGSRRVKGRKGCWGESKSSTKKGGKRKTARKAYKKKKK